MQVIQSKSYLKIKGLANVKKKSSSKIKIRQLYAI